MDAATARARLQIMVQDTVNPTLTSAEVDDLLLMARRTDPQGNTPLDAWKPATIYLVGQQVVPTVFNGHLYTVTVAGTSGAVEPVWPLGPSAIIVNGGVTWQEAGAYLWSGAYALKAAAAEGWRWKAAKITDQYDVVLGTGYTFSRDQLLQHCLAMADRYSRAVVSSIELQTASTSKRTLAIFPR